MHGMKAFGAPAVAMLEAIYTGYALYVRAKAVPHVWQEAAGDLHAPDLVVKVHPVCWTRVRSWQCEW